MGWESFDVVRFNITPLFQGQTRIARHKTRLSLVLEVCNVKPTHRKSWAGNLLLCSDLTLGPYFNIKRGRPNLKVRIIHLLLILEVCNVKPAYRKSCAGNLLMLLDLTLDHSF